jgi:hypothetical protein
VLYATGSLVALLFPEEALQHYGLTDGCSLLVQFTGALLLGLAVASRTARRSPIGGIYGRALTSGNLIRFLGNHCAFEKAWAHTAVRPYRANDDLPTT